MEIEQLINNYKDFLVIVEGQKDCQCLQHLGFTHILILNKPLFAVVEEVVAQQPQKVVLLTDLDTAGKKLYRYLYKHLTRHGIPVDDTLRHFLFKETPVRQIEGLCSYLGLHKL
ncbi:hypothetical protein GF342_01805 [Candidatus Woesearchaeota archaeon]|nr:hypothetical protein [Candidatus Woesearchaeota archaeon]